MQYLEPENWTPMSWAERPSKVGYTYPDTTAVARAAADVASLPPLVTSGEVERLKQQIAEAQEGKRFLLQGGDCAETLDECRPDVITSKLKILLQMSLVLAFAGNKPVIRVGRMAGQYAKPRSSPTESRAGGPALPSYFGDLINRAEFTAAARTPDPRLMVAGYQHAGLTLNFVRSLIAAGFADMHHPEYWDLGFLKHAGLTPEVRQAYERLTGQLVRSVRFVEAVGERAFESIGRVEFFTSHEGLNLHYESAQTRRVPRKAGHWNLTTHLPWVGERTRALDGAHIEYFRGIRNPVGIKVGPACSEDELLRLIDVLNPAEEAGKIVVIARMGAAKVRDRLGKLAAAVGRAGKHVLWISDPMHGNSTTTKAGFKTRSFDEILGELNGAWEALEAAGTRLGGVHIELTGQDVTECIGGAAGIGEDDLSRNYVSLCDPRLNYEQSMELALLLAQKMQAAK